PRPFPSVRHRRDSSPPVRGLRAYALQIAPSSRDSARESALARRLPAHGLEPAETPAIVCGQTPRVHRAQAVRTTLAGVVPRLAFVLTLDSTSQEGSGYARGANHNRRACTRYDSTHSTGYSLCE